jgi:hypothetical protein
MKVVIIVSGGVVQSVLVDDENIKVLVLDQDNEDDGNQFIDSDGNIFTASADTFKKVDKKGVDQYFNLL